MASLPFSKSLGLLPLLLLVSINAFIFHTASADLFEDVKYAISRRAPAPSPYHAHPPADPPHHHAHPPAHPPAKPPVHPHPPVKPPVHPPAKPPVHHPYPPMKPPVHPPVKPPVHPHPPVKPPVHPPAKPPVYPHPPVHPPAKPPVHPHPPVKPPVHPPVKPPTAPPPKPPVYPPSKSPVPPPVRRAYVVVQGVVSCVNPKYWLPIKGSVVKLVCKSTKYTTVKTATTDKNGYYLISAPTVSSYAASKCKVYLVSSPQATCKKPGKVGAYGAPLLKPKYSKVGGKWYALYTITPLTFLPN